MKTLILTVLVIGIAVAASDRKKRQSQQYGYGGYQGAAPYQQPARPAQHHQAPPQAHQQQQQHSYQPQQHGYNHASQPQQYGAPAHKAAAPGEEEKEEGPHPLTKLLEGSKFDCGSKSDGYYGDVDVGCQAFHYCVSGHKHSMMCPAGTVFHQVHLNCVPSDQDICAKADKFFFVNDYLNKPLEQRGPNNTVQYHQRYYPEGYSVGDPFIPPAENKAPAHAQGQAAGYGYGQQPAAHQIAPPHAQQQAAYGPPHARPAYQQQQHSASPHASQIAYQQPPAHAAPSHGAAFQQAQAYSSHNPQHQSAQNYHGHGAAAPPAPAYGNPQHYQSAGQQQQYGAAPARSRFATQY